MLVTSSGEPVLSEQMFAKGNECLAGADGGCKVQVCSDVAWQAACIYTAVVFYTPCHTASVLVTPPVFWSCCTDCHTPGPLSH